MQADVVRQAAQAGQDLPVPIHVGGQPDAARSACDQLDGGIGILHHLGGLPGADRVLVGRNMAELPGAVHLVAQAPQLHGMRFAAAVRGAQVGVAGARRAVAVLDPVARFFRRTGAEIDREHRRPAHVPAQADVLVGAEPVRLDALPRQLAHRRALGAWADAVLPVVAGDEVAARIAHRRHVQPPQRGQHVRPAAVGIRVGAVGIVDSLVHRASHVLEEPAEHAGIDRCNPKLRVRNDLRRLQSPLLHALKLTVVPPCGGEAPAEFDRRPEINRGRGSRQHRPDPP